MYIYYIKKLGFSIIELVIKQSNSSSSSSSDECEDDFWYQVKLGHVNCGLAGLLMNITSTNIITTTITNTIPSSTSITGERRRRRRRRRRGLVAIHREEIWREIVIGEADGKPNACNYLNAEEREHSW